MRRKAAILIAASVFVAGVAAVLWFVTQSLWESSPIQAAFEESDCPIRVRTYLDARVYAGPLIDTHIHMPAVPDGPVLPGMTGNDSRPLLGVNTTISDYVCMMDTEGTRTVFAFFPVWDPIREESLAVAQRTIERYPGRFVPFIMPPDRDDSPDGFPTVTADVLEAMLTVHPGLFQGYGEIGLYARGDHGGPTGAPALPPNAPRLLRIYPVLRSHNLLAYVHLGEGQAAAFEEVLAAHPDINFIWHGDQLIRGSGVEQDLSVIEGILRRHPNAYYGVDELYGDRWLLKPEVSKEEFLTHFKNSESLLQQDLITWKGFIERYPNQVLWGTDRGWSAPWSVDQDVALALNDYSRAFIGRLHPAVQEKFAYKNAERLISGQ